MQRPAQHRPECDGLSGRRKLVLGGIAAAIAAVVVLLVASQMRGRPSSDCDIVRDLLAYNRQFTEQTKTSAETNNPELSTLEQYRDWAVRLKDDAARINDPGLSARANSAAALAAQTTELVPKYRAKPDDAEISRQYARIGIEFANAVTSLDYSCANPTS